MMLSTCFINNPVTYLCHTNSFSLLYFWNLFMSYQLVNADFCCVCQDLVVALKKWWIRWTKTFVFIYYSTSIQAIEHVMCLPKQRQRWSAKPLRCHVTAGMPWHAMAMMLIHLDEFVWREMHIWRVEHIMKLQWLSQSIFNDMHACGTHALCTLRRDGLPAAYLPYIYNACLSQSSPCKPLSIAAVMFFWS